jgi:DNA repair exonuclease SbcCD nuclease subunit
MAKYLHISDIHLSETKPRCRLDEDWIQTQSETLDFVFTTALKENSDIIATGDIFHQSVVHPKIVNMLLLKIEKFNREGFKFYALAGQHDLPYHRWEDVDNSSFGILWNSGLIKDLSDIGTAAHFGQPESIHENPAFVFLHTLTFPHSDEIPPYIKDAIGADLLLKKYPQAKYICTGDYHHGFIYEEEGRYVINPGCLTVQKSDMIDYQPFIVLIDAGKEIVKKIFVPSDSKLVTDEYVKSMEDRDERIESFVESIEKSGKLSLSFEDNLKEAMVKNKDVLGTAIEIINELLEENKS